MDGDQDEMAGPGVLAVPEREWEQARLRAGVISRLAEHDPVGLAAVDEAAMELGISRRRVYVLLERYRRGSGLVTDLVPGDRMVARVGAG